MSILASVSAPAATAPAHAFTASMSHQIDAIGNRGVARGSYPGIGIAVVEDGRIVYARGFGLAQIAGHTRFTPNTQTDVAQVSEPFTAAALLLLQQDGKLKLDDHVKTYVPELTAASTVTISELLTHTSGLPDCTRMAGFTQRRSAKAVDIVEAMNKLPPVSLPGTHFARNSCDYLIAGLIVERVSGIPLSDYLQQNIFMPLVMNQTFYAGDSGIASSRAYGYTGAAHRFTRVDTWDPAWLFGDSGVVTNLYDLAKWDIGLPLLLRVDAERDMFTPQASAGEERDGLGWVIDQRDGMPYIWQNGEIPGYHAMNALLPDEHIAVIVLTNRSGFRSAAVAPEAVAAQVLDIVLPPTTAHVENTILERAREWLSRLADHRIDRTQLTASFSAYLTDDLVAKSNFAALGRVQSLVPISSTVSSSGDTVYEFLVRFAHERYHYRFAVTKDGKIDGLVLTP